MQIFSSCLPIGHQIHDGFSTVQAGFWVKHYCRCNNVERGSTLNTDLPKFSAAVQHKERGPCLGSKRGKKSKLTERVPALNSKRVFTWGEQRDWTDAPQHFYRYIDRKCISVYVNHECYGLMSTRATWISRSCSVTLNLVLSRKNYWPFFKNTCQLCTNSKCENINKPKQCGSTFTSCLFCVCYFFSRGRWMCM